MVGIMAKCSKCGERFCRGVYPSKVCEQCQITRLWYSPKKKEWMRKSPSIDITANTNKEN